MSNVRSFKQNIFHQSNTYLHASFWYCMIMWFEARETWKIILLKRFYFLFIRFALFQNYFLKNAKFQILTSSENQAEPLSKCSKQNECICIFWTKKSQNLWHTVLMSGIDLFFCLLNWGIMFEILSACQSKSVNQRVLTTCLNKNLLPK